MEAEDAHKYLEIKQDYDRLEEQLFLYLDSGEPLTKTLRRFNLSYLKSGIPKAKRPKNVKMTRDLRMSLSVRLLLNNGYEWTSAYNKVGGHFHVSPDTVKKAWPKLKNAVKYYEHLHGKILKGENISDGKIERLAKYLDLSLIEHLNKPS